MKELKNVKIHAESLKKLKKIKMEKDYRQLADAFEWALDHSKEEIENLIKK